MKKFVELFLLGVVFVYTVDLCKIVIKRIWQHMIVKFARLLNWTMLRCVFGKDTNRQYSDNGAKQSTRLGGPVLIKDAVTYQDSFKVLRCIR